MQIEKHDDKNLYCYITAEDLHELNLFYDALAYGSNGFRKLLSVILNKAAEECPFNAHDLPLLVEAVPLKHEELFIQICAIDEAEELDPRFAQFSPSIFDELDLEEDEDSDHALIAADELYLSEASDGEKSSFSAAGVPADARSRRSSSLKAHRTIYTFETYEALITALHAVGSAEPFSQTRSVLYYQPEDKIYHLVLLQHRNTPAFRSLLASFCEYSTVRPLTPSAQAWLNEHCRCLIRTHAISRLMTAVT